ncbi:MAG: malate dehydrogenase [Gammaproteobacteria bacterium (ex Lamellibrachia satsuma)]|nr:MAG: malate dehydrogenase [Gammaproteobacteria bacterium (ex Lamellibrachia satsuma)]RRS32978.1 MAG: malate dehydrogenase [Gammaproteobacteria bacterium (ex Lamellibrachia satsuma)]RRS36637.1 MAG: malate dehydrogenase [Gammaproteobacteria bacterium (ex Lamellibrachia satsuma)]
MKRKKIAVVGGGQIGGILALLVAQKELGDLVILDIPDKENFIKGKALDIMQMRPNDGVDVELSGNSDFSAMEGADVVLVTAGMPRKPGMSRDDLLNINLNIIRNVADQVKQHAPNALVIITTNPLDAMVYAFYKLSGLPKAQVAGMAGALDGARFRTFIAMETGLSVQDVSCLVMGGHGPSMVPLVRTATVGGVPITDLLSVEQIQAIVRRTQDAGTELVKLYETGSAYFSTASAVIEMAEAYLKDKQRVIPSAALCEGEYGVNGLFLGVPAVIGGTGVERILEFELSSEEREMLDATVAAVSKTVEETGL